MAKFVRKLTKSISKRLPAAFSGRVEHLSGHHHLFYRYRGPMNGMTVRLEVVREIIVDLKMKAIVETGTFRATTTQWLAEFGLPVSTCEISQRYAVFSRQRLKRFSNVELVAKSSIHHLSELAQNPARLGSPVFFYLDAHWGEYLPLQKELEIIFSAFPESVVVVDDFCVPGDRGYGFDDFGAGKRLDLDYVKRAAIPNPYVFFPSVPSSQETGTRTGWVVMTVSPSLAARLGQFPLLKANETDADRQP